MKSFALPLQNFKAIDLKSFGFGLAGVCILYVMIFTYIFLSARATLTEIESGLASVSSEIIIDKSVSHTQNSGNNHSAPKNIPEIEGLTEESEFGHLPVVREKDGLTVFRAYQQPFDFTKVTKPVIIFIVKDFGLSADTSQTALDTLPAEVGFVLSPYSALPDEWIKLAREKNHEVWMNTPIENNVISHNDEGQATIFARTNYSEKLKSLFWSLGRGSGYIGVAAQTDDILLSNKEDFSNLTDEIYERGMGFLELNPNANSFIESKALTKDAPYVKADMEIIRMTGKNSFEELEEKIKEKNIIIAVVPNYPVQIKNLAAWILKIGQVSYTIAPASALFDLALYQNTKYNPPAQNAPIAAAPEPQLSEQSGSLHKDDLVEPPPVSDTHHEGH